MEILEKVVELVKPQYDTLDCWVHSWPHIERVSTNTDLVARREGQIGPDYINCMISAYCHDLGRIEEEARKQGRDEPLPHALFSIEPTTDVLRQVEISGINFAKIIEAVAVHSYRIYEGNNEVAKILQDSDKLSAFGSFGVLSIIKHFGGRDYIESQEILKNKDNREVLHKMCIQSFNEADDETRKKTLRGLGFVLEWYDMLHTQSAKDLIKEEYEYTKEMKIYLEKLN